MRLTGRLLRRAGGWGDLKDQPRTPLRITDRDRLPVVDVDSRHPEVIDEDAVGAPIDGHPMGTNEPQHNIQTRRLRRWAGVPELFQRDVAPGTVADNHVAARGEDIPHRSDPYG